MTWGWGGEGGRRYLRSLITLLTKLRFSAPGKAPLFAVVNAIAKTSNLLVDPPQADLEL